VYSVLIAGTVYYWQHRQMTGGGVARFTACDILSLREAGRQAERERDTHTRMHNDFWHSLEHAFPTARSQAPSKREELVQKGRALDAPSS
jgi:hypothetical protein